MKRKVGLYAVGALFLLSGARPSLARGVGEAEAPVVESRFLDLAAAKDSILAGALWGAMDQEKDARGVLVQTHLLPGMHTGTMGTGDHRSFKYTVEARQYAPTLTVLNVKIEEDGVEGAHLYQGALYHSGLQGELVRVNEDGSWATVAVWDFRQKPERGGKDPRSPQ